MLFSVSGDTTLKRRLPDTWQTLILGSGSFPSRQEYAQEPPKEQSDFNVGSTAEYYSNLNIVDIEATSGDPEPADLIVESWTGCPSGEDVSCLSTCQDTRRTETCSKRTCWNLLY